MGGGLPEAMSERGCVHPPVTRRVFQYLAVPTDDRGLTEAAISGQANLRWAPQGRTKPHMDWAAYQNLLQLTGILTMAGIGSARRVWEHVDDFVKMTDTAQVELLPTKSKRLPSQRRRSC